MIICSQCKKAVFEVFFNQWVFSDTVPRTSFQNTDDDTYINSSFISDLVDMIDDC